MTTIVKELHDQYLKAHNLDGFSVPFTAVKIFKENESIPEAVSKFAPDNLTITSCQANRQAENGDPVCLTLENIGCVAAAISLGLVDKNQEKPLGESTVYTDIMKDQSGQAESFQPPTPAQFTEGTVYACGHAGHPEFALFGETDPGRFKDIQTARTAINDMAAIQPATTKAVFLFPANFEDADITPDVVILSLRPVELTRFIQGYWFETGERIQASMGGLRMVNSDLIARPYLSGEINVSTYCLGARLIAQFGSERMGVGVPFEKFQTAVKGLENSKEGYPFQLYPGAKR